MQGNFFQFIISRLNFLLFIQVTINSLCVSSYRLHLLHRKLKLLQKTAIYFAKLSAAALQSYLVSTEWNMLLSRTSVQFEAEVFNPPDVFPLIPIVNKSWNIERCVNNMLQIIQNMMVSQCSELELSVFRGTTLSGQHPSIYVWVQNFQKYTYSTPWSHWYLIISSSKP